MTKRIAYIISAVAILIGISFSAYDMHRMSIDSTSQILRECGINPVTGGDLNAR